MQLAGSGWLDGRSRCGGVVAAELEHEHVHGLAEDPVHTIFAACGGFAAVAGVYTAVGQAEAVNFLLNQGWESSFRGQLVGRREAVSKKNDCLARLGLGGSGGAFFFPGAGCAWIGRLVLTSAEGK